MVYSSILAPKPVFAIDKEKVNYSLFDGFDVDVSVGERKFLPAFGASAVKALDDFVRRSQLNAFVEDGSTFLTRNSLRHLIPSYDLVRIQKRRN